MASGGGGGPPTDIFRSPPLFRLSLSLLPFGPPRLVLRSVGIPPANKPANCCGGSAAAVPPPPPPPILLLAPLAPLELLPRSALSIAGADLSSVTDCRSPALPNDAMSPSSADRPPSPDDELDPGAVAEAEKRAAGLLLHEKPAAGEGGGGAAGAVGGPGGGGTEGETADGGGGGGVGA